MEKDLIRREECDKQGRLVLRAQPVEVAAQSGFQRPVLPSTCEGQFARARKIEWQVQWRRQNLELVQPVLFGLPLLGRTLQAGLLACVIDKPQRRRQLAWNTAPARGIELTHFIENDSQRSPITDQVVNS